MMLKTSWTLKMMITSFDQNTLSGGGEKRTPAIMLCRQIGLLLLEG